jgi:hypothetical protein
MWHASKPKRNSHPSESSSLKSSGTLRHRAWASVLLALFLYPLVGCTKDKKDQGSNGTPAPVDSLIVAVPPLDTSNAAAGFHAKPLEAYAERVPPLVISDWLKQHFPLYIPSQGVAPSNWSDLEKRIQPEACGACHQSQYNDWKESLHHKGMGPTVLGQLLDMELDEPLLAISCQRCHAPLSEQIPYLTKGVRNPDFVPGFREKGLTCAACHVRQHTRHGPPPRRPGAETDGPHDGFVIKTEYESPAFCASCHDFEGAGAMHGKLIQETAQEWRRTEFAAKGITCQNCHMPDRRHLWKGIHDSAMVHSAVSIQLETQPPESKADSLVADLNLTNVGAGHRLPTYIEPQILLILEQLDAKGKPIPGTRAEGIIARKVTEEMDKEVFDTRLMPGETFHLNYKKTLHAKAKTLLARVEVWPDEAYRLYFMKMLATPSLRPTMPEVVENMNRAVKLDTDSRYLLWEKKLPI